MEFSDFEIGREFWTRSGRWRCTDVGTRVVIAIKLGPREIGGVEFNERGERVAFRTMSDDPVWFEGPPYAIAECIFDEYAMEVCYRTEEKMRREFD